METLTYTHTGLPSTNLEGGWVELGCTSRGGGGVNCHGRA